MSDWYLRGDSIKSMVDDGGDRARAERWWELRVELTKVAQQCYISCGQWGLAPKCHNAFWDEARPTTTS